MNDTDTLLVEKVLSGSLECFDVLMQRYEREVYRAVYGFGKSRENAMDICQYVSLKAYRNLGGFDSLFLMYSGECFDPGSPWFLRPLPCAG